MGMIYKQKGSKNFWIKYYRGGQPIRESSGTDKESDARRFLRLREGDVAKGLPVAPRMDKIAIEELFVDIINEYATNKRRSLKDLKRRIKLHLLPFFRGRWASLITTADVRKFIVLRQEAGASNAEINRELAVLKRAFNLAVQAAKILFKPHVPMLKENNVRQGFFELEQFEEVLKRLPEPVQPIIRFAYRTGWRVTSEILPLEWRQVDFQAGTVRLDPGTTKNGEGRVFPFTKDVRTLLEAQRRHTEALQLRLGIVCPWVFHREGKPIKDFRGAWERACTEAGMPDRIQHDFRRTAVRNLERASVPRSVAMKLTGHKTESVYRRYAIVAESDLAEGVAKLDKLAAAGVL